MGKKKGSGGAAPAAKTGKHSDKKLAKLTMGINNLKAKIEDERGMPSDEELQQKLVQDRKDYKEAPYSFH